MPSCLPPALGTPLYCECLPILQSLVDLYSKVETAMDTLHPPERLASNFDQTVLFGYIPTGWICIVLLVFFGLSTRASFLLSPTTVGSRLTPLLVGHFCQAVYFRLWWLLPTAVAAGILELIGWGAREWASKISNEPNFNPYLIQ